MKIFSITCSERGTSAIEYALCLAMLALVAISTAENSGRAATDPFCKLNNAMGGSSSSTMCPGTSGTPPNGEWDDPPSP